MAGFRWLLGQCACLAYAEEHGDRVTELVLRGIFTLRRSELDFYYNGAAGQLFPERYEAFLAPLGGRSFVGDAISAYHDLLFDPDPAVHGPAGVAWSGWEAATITLEPDEGLIADFSDPTFALAFARIENHYFFHRGWFTEGQLIANAGRLAGIPGVIIQGRYDLATPAVTAYDLHHAWPEAELTIVPVAGRILGARHPRGTGRSHGSVCGRVGCDRSLGSIWLRVSRTLDLG